MTSIAPLTTGERQLANMGTGSLVTVHHEVEHVAAKKKVNGFMGFRAYYSSIFSQFPQRGRSPLVTKLWRQDPFHNEWDFMCAVYSAIRTSLDKENITFKDWINSAVIHLWIISRDNYMEALGWQFERLEDGTNTLLRTTTPPIQNRSQPMNGLGLFNSCLSAGLPVNDARSIIAKLSDPSYDVICMTTQSGTLTQNKIGYRTTTRKTPDNITETFMPSPQSHPAVSRPQMNGFDEVHGIFYPDYPHHYEGLDPETVFAVHGSTIDAMLGTILNSGNVAQTQPGVSNDGCFFDMSLLADYGIGPQLQDVDIDFQVFNDAQLE